MWVMQGCAHLWWARYLKGYIGLSCSARRTLTSRPDGEVRITRILKEKFPNALSVKVVDISGGCGDMYEIHVESADFKEKKTVQQHQMINQALKEEIKGMHGLRIYTTFPKH
ncbi:bolA-like protein 3 [Ambystoma mexicanum]|uniref:bolA-like protein 3 n=1 Tax=Ambystoma mexicanum TaxID=8296 RepID=UPI0037E93DFF